MSTFDAPVAARISSTFAPSACAVIAFDLEVSYVQLKSSTAGYPSATKRSIIVPQIAPFEFQP